ncbi:hypothetical protein GR138_12080 [Shinella kummerowiae]|jgi:hypothetical protein|uniref:Uncharacterized protein n=1 Tax=Shinella kummerowiae TaxID=417745 RepID=A0A6N8SGA6_9HYPH|nr:LamG domain-containing protein [Shinella kummerowiae]MXN45932.1 hypothetical protein [Shinella kummerowiae]
MTIYQQTDVVLSSPSLFGTVRADENGAKIAKLPGLIDWWSADPSFTEQRSDGTLDWFGRVNRKTLRTPGTAVPLFTQGLAGRHTFEFDGTQEFDAIDFALPTATATVAFVARLADNNASLRTLVGPATTAVGAKSFSFSWSSGTARIVHSGTSLLIDDQTGTWYDTDLYGMVTQSNISGMSIWRNGTQAKRGTGLNAVLTDTSLSVGNGGVGSTARFIGEISDILVFDVDVSATEYASSRAILNTVLADWAS